VLLLSTVIERVATALLLLGLAGAAVLAPVVLVQLFLAWRQGR
jgi:hypothetical protein